MLSRLGVRQPECLFLPYYPFSDGVIDKYALEFGSNLFNIDKFACEFNQTQRGTDSVPSPFCRVPDLIEGLYNSGTAPQRVTQRIGLPTRVLKNGLTIVVSVCRSSVH